LPFRYFLGKLSDSASVEELRFELGHASLGTGGELQVEAIIEKGANFSRVAAAGVRQSVLLFDGFGKTDAKVIKLKRSNLYLKIA
jgi:hypothetical protein